MIGMQPMIYEKGPKNYEVAQQQLQVPICLSKKLNYTKNHFHTHDEDDKQILKPKIKNSSPEKLPVPNEMSQAFIRYMLVYRVTSYLIVVSMTISTISQYSNHSDDTMMILANNGITIMILITLLMRLKLYKEFNKTKIKDEDLEWEIADFIDIVLILPHPTLWTRQDNHFLRLAIMFRILIPIKYLIYSSVYCDVRAYRLITTYGLNSREHFFFAVKSLVAELNVLQIFAIELFAVIFFSDCLYLVSLGEEIPMHFMDCFEVVIVSMPTVGFGEYDLPYTGQKIIVIMILVMGAVLNSFITLSMLNLLQMNQSQLSSYWLYQKVQTRQHIQKISKNYIQKSFGVIRRKNIKTDKEVMNFSFRNEYRIKKNLYNSISYTDINNLFAYFRESLKEFRLKAAQTNNMTIVVLRNLQKQNFRREHGDKN